MRLGEYQKLVVIKKVEFGVYLAERMENETRVLLPEKQVPEGTKIGDELRVFLYKDSKDRLIATTNTPKLRMHLRSQYLPSLESMPQSHSFLLLIC